MLHLCTLRQMDMPEPGDRFVLLVDDHARTLFALRQVVELAGHACFAMISSSEALRFCRERQPTIVVTDLAMPGLDGHVLGRSLRASYPSIPILLVTGELLDDAELIQLTDTFNAVMTKPLEIDRFLTLIESLMPPLDDQACP